MQAGRKSQNRPWKSEELLANLVQPQRLLRKTFKE